jgi:actin-related protein
LWTDRYRGSELLFQPSIIGLECAGLTESIETLFSQLQRQQVEKLLKNVVILGGNTLTPGFDQRIRHELTMLCKQGTPINIVNEFKTDQRQVEPWLGAVNLARNWMSGNSKFSEYVITRELY